MECVWTDIRSRLPWNVCKTTTLGSLDHAIGILDNSTSAGCNMVLILMLRGFYVFGKG